MLKKSLVAFSVLAITVLIWTPAAIADVPLYPKPAAPEAEVKEKKEVGTTARDSAAAQQKEAAVSSEDSGLDWDVAFGIRWKYYALTSNNDFVGSITSDTIDEKMEWFPTNANLLILPWKYGGLSFEYDYFRQEMQNDGDLFWHTLTLAANFRYPIEDLPLSPTPYLAIGLTYNMPYFDEEDWWFYASGDRIRKMDADNAWGFVVGGGFDLFLTDNLALNFDMRWYKASVDVEYTIRWRNDNGLLQYQEFDYDIDSITVGLGLRWYF